MKHTNKKGFTIVELVIVIAVIAILAAVLIPTFSNLIKKANISNDTAVAKNLNTAAISAQADTFAKAIAAAKDAGYLVAHLNAKADGCYFVWEQDTKQFILFDIEKGKVLYSNTTVGGDAPDDSWYFVVNNVEDKNAVLAKWEGVKVQYLVGDVVAIKDVLAAGGEIYIDESLVLDNDNLLVLDNANANTTLVLGSAQLNTNGMLENEVPVQIKAGNVTIVGGIIGGAGSYIDDDGNLVNSPLETSAGSNTTIDGTTFNVGKGGYVTFLGDATIKNTVINTENIGVYCGVDAQVVLENVTIDADGRCVWVTNWNGVNHTDGTAQVTIKSGTYTGGSATYAPLTAYSGDIVVEGGVFTSNTEYYFYVMEGNGSITVKGGVFGGKDLSELDIEDIKDMCQGNLNVVKNDDGSYTITIIK